MNFHELQDQLLMFTVATNILFGKLSVGSQCLKVLSNMMNRYKSIFKAKERLDEEFPAKFIFAVDTRFQIWLNNCKSAKFCNKVDDSIINFRPLINQVIFGSFNMNLPPTFSIKVPKDTLNAGTRAGGKRKEDDDDKCNKKKGKGNGEKHTLVKNPSPHSEICMLTNETWAGNFAGKHFDQRPNWNEKCKCCPRLFLQKYCFSNCPNVESHVPSSEDAGVGQSMPQLTGRVGV